MMQMERQGEHPTGLAAIQAMLLTGLRRMEVLGMHKEWIEPEGNCLAFPDTKSGPQLRAVDDAAVAHLLSQAQRSPSPFVFLANWSDGPFIGVVRVLDRVCARGAGGRDPHTLRHTFACIAASLGFSELTISGVLGHPRWD